MSIQLEAPEFAAVSGYALLTAFGGIGCGPGPIAVCVLCVVKPNTGADHASIIILAAAAATAADAAGTNKEE